MITRILNSLLDCIQPRVVVLEFNPHCGPDCSLTISYQPDFRLDFSVQPYRCGASLSAFVKLGQRKGYRLVVFSRLDSMHSFARDIRENRERGTVWRSKLVASNTSSFGQAVAVSGDYAYLVGGRQPNSTSPVSPGQAHIFVKTGTGWSEQTTVLPVQPAGHE